MKPILRLFALVLLCINFSYAYDAFPGGWKEYDPKEFMKDARYQEILDEAKQQFIAQASRTNEISGTQLTVKDVKGAATQVVSGLNIRYDVDLVGADGKVYDVSLVVWYQPWKKSTMLIEYNIYRIN